MGIISFSFEIGRRSKIPPPPLLTKIIIKGLYSSWRKDKELRSWRKETSPIMRVIGFLSLSQWPQEDAIIPSIPLAPL